MAKVIERVQACYEVQDLEMGKVYRWRPESVLVECECREKLTLTAFDNTYCTECGADHRATVGEAFEARSEEDEEEIVVRPWRSQRPYYAPSRGT